jgi:DNA-directed RNA polymerase subunit alpha
MSKVIHNPLLANIEEHSAVSSTFTIEPLHAGYGNTLGNSLRRVLLSSIEGAAIVAFRIEGATHEFTTVAGIVEDVVDIMLNLKNVRLKVHTDQQVTLKHLLTLRLSTQNKSFVTLTTQRNQLLLILLSNQVAATVLSRKQANHASTAT